MIEARYASLIAFAQSRGSDCGRDPDGKFGGGNKCAVVGGVLRPQSTEQHEQEPSFSDKDDDHVYHVTTQGNAASIISEGFKQSGSTVKGGAYETYSKGKLFFTEKSGLATWKGKIEDHLFHEYDDPPPVAIVRVKKSEVEHLLKPDEIGTKDAGSKAYYVDLTGKKQSRAFCATGQGNGIDNSCGAKATSAPDKDGGGGKASDYDPGHFDVGPDPNGLTEKDLMYSPTVKWTQDHKSLVRDAVKSWKGSPTDMTLHVMSELKGDGTPGSGSGKIMRAQATALLTEVLDNGEPAPTLYRGASIPPEQDPSPLLGWTSKKSVAVAFAKKNNGEVYTLEGATGLNTSKIKAHGMGEAEWIVAHNIPDGYQVYHGTNADDPESLDFNEVSKSTNSTDLGDYDTTRHGVFFSNSKAFASEYGKNVGKFSLDLKSVADLTTPAGGNHSDVVHQFLDSLDAAGNENNRRVYLTALHSNPWKPWLMFEGDVGEKFVSWLKDEGYDAARFKEYTGNDVGGNTTVVFDKKKIKPKKEDRAFCPNGEGNGVTNNCGPGQTAKSFPKGSQNLRDAVDSVAPDPKQVWNRSKGLAETPAPKQMDDIANEQTSYSGAALTPEAEASYGSLVDEIGRQYEALTAAGLKARAWRGEGEPYGDPPGSTKPNSDKMRQEVAKTGEFSFYMTDKGFGTGDATPDHPMLRETKFKTADGEPMIANDLFRVVHDMVAHVRGGYSFSTNGEYNGMLTHASTLPEEAWPALFAETFGQNAVYEKTKNYAPQNAYASKVGPAIIRSELKKRNKSSRAAKADSDEPLGYQHIKSRPALLKSLVEQRAFCATGQGNGIDNSCGGKGGAKVMMAPDKDSGGGTAVKHTMPKSKFDDPRNSDSWLSPLGDFYPLPRDFKGTFGRLTHDEHASNNGVEGGEPELSEAGWMRVASDGYGSLYLSNSVGQKPSKSQLSSIKDFAIASGKKFGEVFFDDGVKAPRALWRSDKRSFSARHASLLAFAQSRGDAPAPKKDKIKGSEVNADGSAKNKSGDISLDESTISSLKKKVEEHNAAMREAGKPDWTHVRLPSLKAVFRRGAGAFSTSHRPGMTRDQWAMARVNAFLTLARRGRPENAKYVTDNDLLHSSHPKHSTQARAFCATGEGNGIDNSCGAKTMSAPDRDGGGGSAASPYKYFASESDALKSAVTRWKGDPTDLGIHVQDEIDGLPPPPSGSGTKLREMASALLKEVKENGRPAPTLYRGDNKTTDDNSSALVGWSSNRRVAEKWADRYGGTLQTLEGASGVKLSDIVGKTMDTGEDEWIVLNARPATSGGGSSGGKPLPSYANDIEHSMPKSKGFDDPKNSLAWLNPSGTFFPVSGDHGWYAERNGVDGGGDTLLDAGWLRVAGHSGSTMYVGNPAGFAPRGRQLSALKDFAISTDRIKRIIFDNGKSRSGTVLWQSDEARSADCGREDDGKFASGNKCGGSVDMPKEDPRGRMRYDNGVQTDAARKLYQMGSSEKKLKSLVDVMGGDPKNTRVDINPPSLNISVADKDGNKLFHVDFENGRARLYPAKDLSPAEAKKIKEAAGKAFGGRQEDPTIKVFSKAADMKRWDSENAAKLKKWEDKYAFSTLLPPHQRPKKWERSVDAKHASLLAFVQSRGFCPNGEGGGVTNTCSSKDSSAPEPEADEPPPALHLLAERDAEAPQAKMKSGDGEVTVVDRTGISTPDYLDEIECHGRDCGLEVTFEEAKRLQPDSDIKDDWSPLDAYVGPGAGYFTGYDGSLGENADGSIDYHGADYGTIDDYYASDLLAEKQKEVEKEWDEMSDDEKNVASMKLLYGVDASPSDEDDVVALREAGKKQWMDDNTYDIEESINAMREEARQNAVKQMAKELESAVAGDTIECCLQLYRGLRVDPAEVDRMISSGYVVHENVNSWTTSRDVSRSFGASRLLLVTRKPRVGHIFSSNAHSEMEVVRPPSRMRILGVVRTSTGTVLHVDEDEDYKGA